MAQGKAYPISLGPAPPAVNDVRVATVLDLKQHLPPTSKIGAVLSLLAQTGLAEVHSNSRTRLTPPFMCRFLVQCQAAQVQKIPLVSSPHVLVSPQYAMSVQHGQY